MVDVSQTQVAYTPQTNPQVHAQPPSTLEDKPAEKDFSFFGDDGLSFWDVVDMVNPLQHIPIISTVYRDMTGDEIDPGARLAGGTLFGGPIGLASSTFNVLLEHNTGKDAGEHVMAWFEGEEQDLPEDSTMVAQNGGSSFANGFAPLIPETEADAFAAGEASLRMAELEEFMNPDLATEVPVAVSQNPVTQAGVGSAGIWSAPDQQNHPFPTERPGETTAFSRRQPAQQNPDIVDQMAVTRHIVNEAQQPAAFQAKQSHLDNIDALKAFARDIQVQQAQKPTTDVNATPATTLPPPALATKTSQLNQTQDNDWFARMIDQNMDRYDASGPEG